MMQSRRIMVGLAAVLTMAAGLAVWLLLGTDARPGPAKVIRVAAPPLQAVAATPDPLTAAQPTQPLSTTAPHGAGLGAPDHLTGTARPVSVTLRWRPVAKALGYEVYRDGRQIGRTTGLSFEDTGLRPGAVHSWTVAAIDTANAPGDPSLPFSGAAGG